MDYEALLRVLADGEIHSGVELGRVLKVSRAAVWKSLDAIQERYGVQITANRSKGYQLARPVELLDQAKLAGGLKRYLPSGLIPELSVHFIIDSTNSYLLECAPRLPTDLLSVCMAEYQTAGRGRRGREWVAEFGSQLCFSVRKRFSSGFASLQGLSLAVGVMISEYLALEWKLDPMLKWPNDVMHSGKKLAGVLIELSGEHNGPVEVVVGVGFNLQLSEREKSCIGQKVVSLKEIVDGPVSRNDVAVGLVANLVSGLERFEKGGFQHFIDAWNARDFFSGKEIDVHGNNRHNGGPYLYKGVSVVGSAVVEMSGVLHELAGGELSLRVTHDLPAP
ncbi:MAG: biotin--[acetyl-CoA-carboxylase] ligase [Hahellaceae bacterium]|jgi:BirA family biotin operon repressor/biotin-[acetyl-CoA-carboxylase] ligase|nr:biotin--[acetyl-CoA-carboxylase] ligase [Hahellaceae bacterium]